MESKIVVEEKEVVTVTKVQDKHVLVKLTHQEFRILRGILGGSNASVLFKEAFLNSQVAKGVFGLFDVTADDVQRLTNQFVNQWDAVEKSLTSD